MNEFEKKTKGILESYDYKLFNKERDIILEDWQYFETSDISNNDRYSLDKEAYIETFCSNKYTTDVEFDEKIFINHILSNLKDVKHNIWVKYKDFLTLKLKSIGNKKTTEQLPKKEFIDAFEDKEDFKKVIDILIEKKICDKETYNIIDQKEYDKGYVITLLKHLHNKGYYKENTPLTIDEIKNIAQNTFGVKISISHIKQYEPNYFYFRNNYNF